MEATPSLSTLQGSSTHCAWLQAAIVRGLKMLGHCRGHGWLATTTCRSCQWQPPTATDGGTNSLSTAASSKESSDTTTIVVGARPRCRRRRRRRHGWSAGDVPTAMGNTFDATGEWTSETGLVKLKPLMLMSYSGASLDHNIMEDPMLMELTASLASSRFVTCPLPRHPTHVLT